MGRRRTPLIGVILLVFIGSALSLAAMLVRSGLRQVVSYTPFRHNEQRAWRSLEDFWAYDMSCTKFLRGRRRGESVLQGRGVGPRVGGEWRDSGLLVKDVYVLTLAEEVTWHVRRRDHGPESLYVKVTLIPKPRVGVELNVSYLKHAPPESRIFHVRTRVRERERTVASVGMSVWRCQNDKAPGMNRGP